MTIFAEHLPGKHDQRRHGRHRGATVSADEAIDILSGGGSPNVEPSEVGALMDAAVGRTDNLDLTEVRVNGTLKFGGDGLGYGRTEMPVLGSAHLPGYLADVRARGISITEARMDPASLKPMQHEVSLTSTARLYQGMKTGSLAEKPLVVSSDGFVADGHHRWGASTALSFERPGLTVSVIKVGLTGHALRSDALAWNAENGIKAKAIGEALVEHLPGKHNQLAHGRKGSVGQGIGKSGGGSYDASGSSLKTGAVVAISGYSMPVDAARFDSDPAFRRQVIKDWQKDNAGRKFGTWDSRSAGGSTIVFDRIEHFTGPGARAKAIKLGRERGEDGIFDIDKNEYVPTGGKTYTEAEVDEVVKQFLGAFEAPPAGTSEAELDAWADAVGNAIVATLHESDSATLARVIDAVDRNVRLTERAYVRDRRGRFAYTGGRGTGGPLQDSMERNMVGGAWNAERTALHDGIIAKAQDGVAAHPGEQVAIMTGGGAASGKSTTLAEMKARGDVPDDFVEVNADLIKTELPDYQANIAAGKVYAARDAHEESSYVSKRMYRESLGSGRHTVYDSVGDNGEAKVSAKVAEMRASGATRVDGHYATVHPHTAIARAETRSATPGPDYGRKVDKVEIVRQHRDVSATWLDLANKGTFDTLTLTDRNTQGAPKLIAKAVKGKIEVYDDDAFSTFLSYTELPDPT